MSRMKCWLKKLVPVTPGTSSAQCYLQMAPPNEADA